MFKGVYERSVKNMTEVSEMLNKSTQDASAIINKRVKATMNEVKAAMEKAEKADKAKKAA